MAHPSTSHKPHGVLIVEDDAAIRSLLSEILDLNDYAIFIATNGLEAIERLNDQQSREAICLILTDVLMPEVNGLQMMQYLSEHNIDIPVVVMAANPKYKASALEAGARAWI